MLKLGEIKLSGMNLKENIKIEEVSNKDIAIIGMAVRLPGADSLDGFWDIIKTGRDCVGEIPEPRKKDCDGYLRHIGAAERFPGYMHAAFLDEIDRFDYGFFQINPKEASLMDPSQRLFLETAWEAVEDAGYGGGRLAGSRTGVYVGLTNEGDYSYKQMVYELEPLSVAMAAPGNISAVIPGRIAYLLDLKGPSMLVDTACSSSLAAVHLACQAIRNADCTMAIAGGVRGYLFPVNRGEKLGIESSDGRTWAFDEHSDGTGIGEGVAAILLKPLNEALRDRDNIAAVIKGSAMNQDGATIGLTAPNAAAQADVLCKAWRDAGIHPERIAYIEAHGTGTKLGDPIEIDGLQRAFSRYTDRKQFCAVSSVKTNIGHLNDAAGIAGLVKAVLSLKHRQIPRGINFLLPNRKIGFEESPVYVSDTLREWEADGNKRACGVSSFGLSGTNCHIVLEEAPEEEALEEEALEEHADGGPEIFTLSAKNERSLRQLIQNFSRFLKQSTGIRLKDICYTANTGRGHYNYRLAVISSDKKALAEKLDAILQAGILSSMLDKDIFFGTFRNTGVFGRETDGNMPSDEERRIQSLNADKVLKTYLDHGNDPELLHMLCDFYVKGATLSWMNLYQGEMRRRVNLPTYPFMEERCWLEIPSERRRNFAGTRIGNLANIEDVPPELIDEWRKVTEKNGWEAQSPGNGASVSPKRSCVILQGRGDGAYTPMEIKLAEIWSEVLGYREINIYDSLYELNGDSIQAARIANMINRQLSEGINVVDVLRNMNIYMLANSLQGKHEAGPLRENIYAKLIPLEDREHYPLSSAQRRLFVVNRLGEAQTGYNMPAVMVVHGNIDEKRMEDVFRKLIRRHEALRTSFDFSEGSPVQIIHKEVPFHLEDWSMGGAANAKGCRGESISEIVMKFIRPFDLGRAPLFRAGIVHLSQNEYVFMVDIHHIISDRTSVSILIKEFSHLYNRCELPPLKIRYQDYSRWQNELFESGRIRYQEEYWLDVFSGGIPALDICTDFQRPAVQSFEGDTFPFVIHETLADRLRKYARKSGSTINMVLLAAFNVLLSKYSGQEDIVVGTPVTGRNHGDLENVVGMFVNTLAMRNHPKGSLRFEDFLEDVKRNALRAYENQDYQFEKLVEKLEVKRDFSRNPLFDVMFVMQNMEMAKIELDGFEIEPYAFDGKISKVDFTLYVVDEDNRLHFNFEYCTGLFKKEFFERMSVHFIHILKKITDDPEMTLSQIEMLPEEERHRILFAFNNTAADYPKHKTLQQLFEEQVEKSPDTVAAVFENRQMTYGELNGKSNGLARMLRGKGVKPDSIVGILAERSFELLIGIWGILKAGGAYLPIDPGYPEERIKFMLEDSGAKILLVQDKFHRRFLNGSAGCPIVLMNLEESSLQGKDGINPENANTSSDLAYVIYTSGSTGKPKGVMIEHAAVINRLNWMQRKYPLGRDNAILQKTPYTFDVSVWELFWWSFTGAKVCMLTPGGEKDPGAIAETVEKNRITTIHFVPSMLSVFLEYVERMDKSCGLSSLQHVFASGEALTVQQVEKFNSTLGSGKEIRLFNLYGPTEATVDVSYYECPKNGKIEWVPIGKPIDNIRLYILDKSNRLQPIGVHGELCISGDGVARGYMNRSELNTEKFVPDPFFEGEKMYRTGDLAKWLSDGNIEFLGRMDHQVKIRGFRIELGEVEARLLEHEAVKEAVVIDRVDPDGNKFLCAYLVSGKELPVQEIKKHLSRKLPDYMHPSYFVWLEAIPLGLNGKIDRAGLPEPYTEIHTGVKYMAPENDVEAKITDIWSGVLKLEKDKVGTGDNFFDLGGNSILAIQMHSLLDAEFPGKVSLIDLFTFSDIRRLSEYIRADEKSSLENIPVQLMELPAEYFCDGGEQNEDSIFEFQIDGNIPDRFRRISQQENIGMDALLVTLYIYLLTEITGRKEISVHTMLAESGRVFPLQMDLTRIHDFQTMFGTVSRILKEKHRESGYPLQDMIGLILQKGNSVLPFIYRKGLLPEGKEIPKAYDLVLKIDDDATKFAFTFEFNNERLREGKIREMIGQYGKIIKLFAEQYER